MAFENIVNLVINFAAGYVDRQPFNILMLLDAHAAFEDRAKEYTEASDMLEDAFSEEDAVYRMAEIAFSQKNKPRKVVVGRRDADYLMCRVHTVVDDTDYVHTVNGVDYTYDSGTGATAASIAAGLIALINAAHTSLCTDNSDGTYKIAVDGDSFTSVVDETYLTQANAQLCKVTTWEDAVTFRNTINGEEVDVAVSTTPATNADVASAMVAAINATTLPVFAIIDPTTAYHYWIYPETSMSHFVSTTEVVGGAGTGVFTESYPGVTETVSAAINAIILENNSWWAVASPVRDVDDQVALAAKIEQMKKLHGYATSDEDVFDVAPASDTDTVPAQLKALGYNRSWCFGHEDCWGGADDVFPEVAMMGYIFGKYNPDSKGGVTWAYHALVGVAAYAGLTPTQISNSLGDVLTNTGGKNVTLYLADAGVSMTYGAKVASGEWIDKVLTGDWMYARITEGVGEALLNNDVVPYSNAGIGLIAGVMRFWLKRGVEVGALLNDITTFGSMGFRVDQPSRADITAAVAASRVLSDVKGFGTVANAIHAANLTISLGD